MARNAPTRTDDSDTLALCTSCLKTTTSDNEIALVADPCGCTYCQRCYSKLVEQQADPEEPLLYCVCCGVVIVNHPQEGGMPPSDPPVSLPPESPATTATTTESPTLPLSTPAGPSLEIEVADGEEGHNTDEGAWEDEANQRTTL